MNTVQTISGVSAALDALERRIKAHREVIQAHLVGSPNAGARDTQISEGEVETLEALVLRLARQITGEDPSGEEWERLHPWCSSHEAKKGEYLAQEAEYYRWCSLWVQKTRSYIEYLSGCQSAAGSPRQRGGLASSTSPDTEYDVALSFAGEDRDRARRIATLLRKAGCTLFFDEYEQATLWGRNLYVHLSDVYANRAKYCLVFVSSSYATRIWTRRELEAAQARALVEAGEYILPLRLDDTELPGVERTMGYLDLREKNDQEVVDLLLQKLRST